MMMHLTKVTINASIQLIPEALSTFSTRNGNVRLKIDNSDFKPSKSRKLSKLYQITICECFPLRDLVQA